MSGEIQSTEKRDVLEELRAEWGKLRDVSVDEGNRVKIFCGVEKLVVQLLSKGREIQDRNSEEPYTLLKTVLRWMLLTVHSFFEESETRGVMQRWRDSEARQNVFLLQTIKVVLAVVTWPSFEVSSDVLVLCFRQSLDVLFFVPRLSAAKGPLVQMTDSVFSNAENSPEAGENALVVLREFCFRKNDPAVVGGFILDVLEKYRPLFRRNEAFRRGLKEDVFGFVFSHRKTTHGELFGKCHGLAQVIVGEFWREMKDEASILLEEFYFPILRERESDRTAPVFDFLAEFFCSGNVFLEIYASYDRAVCSECVFGDFLRCVSRFQTVGALEIFGEVIRSTEQAFEKFEAFESTRGSVSDAKKVLLEGVFLFNKSAKEGFSYLEEKGLIRKDQRAEFIRRTPSLCKTQIGDILSDKSRESSELLSDFFSLLDLKGKSLVECLRFIFQETRVLGESQRIERILEGLSERYLQCNQQASGQEEQDRVFQMFYAAMILNTDQHSTHVKRKMTKDVFVSAYDHIERKEFLEGIYDEISAGEIVLEDEYTHSFSQRRKYLLECMWCEQCGGGHRDLFCGPHGVVQPSPSTSLEVFSVVVEVFFSVLSDLENPECEEKVSSAYLRVLFTDVFQKVISGLYRCRDERNIQKAVSTLCRFAEKQSMSPCSVFAFHSVFSLANKTDIAHTPETWRVLLETMARLKRKELIDPLSVPSFEFFYSATECGDRCVFDSTLNLLWAVGRCSFPSAVQEIFVGNLRNSVASLPNRFLSELGTRSIFQPLSELSKSQNETVAVVGLELAERYTQLFCMQRRVSVLNLSLVLAEYSLFSKERLRAVKNFQQLFPEILPTETGEMEEKTFMEELYPVLCAFTRIVVETDSCEIRAAAFDLLREVLLEHAGPFLSPEQWRSVLLSVLSPVVREMES
ncbi:MAG: Sec7 domain-containing protein, partial [Amphiamblys sp. WSBS2006]